MSAGIVSATIRVTVLGDAGRVDLAVPTWIDVATLAAGYAESVGTTEVPVSPPRPARCWTATAPSTRSACDTATWWSPSRTTTSRRPRTAVPCTGSGGTPSRAVQPLLLLLAGTAGLGGAATLAGDGCERCRAGRGPGAAPALRPRRGRAPRSRPGVDVARPQRGEPGLRRRAPGSWRRTPRRRGACSSGWPSPRWRRRSSRRWRAPSSTRTRTSWSRSGWWWPGRSRCWRSSCCWSAAPRRACGPAVRRRGGRRAAAALHRRRRARPGPARPRPARGHRVVGPRAAAGQPPQAQHGAVRRRDRARTSRAASRGGRHRRRSPWWWRPRVRCSRSTPAATSPGISALAMVGLGAGALSLVARSFRSRCRGPRCGSRATWVLAFLGLEVLREFGRTVDYVFFARRGRGAARHADRGVARTRLALGLVGARRRPRRGTLDRPGGRGGAAGLRILRRRAGVYGLTRPGIRPVATSVAAQYGSGG